MHFKVKLCMSLLCREIKRSLFFPLKVGFLPKSNFNKRKNTHKRKEKEYKVEKVFFPGNLIWKTVFNFQLQLFKSVGFLWKDTTRKWIGCLAAILFLIGGKYSTNMLPRFPLVGGWASYVLRLFCCYLVSYWLKSMTNMLPGFPLVGWASHVLRCWSPGQKQCCKVHPNIVYYFLISLKNVLLDSKCTQWMFYLKFLQQFEIPCVHNVFSDFNCTQVLPIGFLGLGAFLWT